MCAESIVKLMEGGTKLPTEQQLKATYIRDYDRAYAPTYAVLDLIQRVPAYPYPPILVSTAFTP